MNSLDEPTWPCGFCNGPIRYRPAPVLGGAHYEHVYPEDEEDHFAVRL